MAPETLTTAIPAPGTSATAIRLPKRLAPEARRELPMAIAPDWNYHY